MLLLPWVIVFSQPRVRQESAASTSGGPAAAPAQPAAATASAPTAHTLPVGPWGELEYTPIVIEPPADTVSRFAAADTSAWHFRDCTPEKLEILLASAGVDERLRRAIVGSSVPDPQSAGLIARPDAATLAALAPDVRTALYQILAQDRRNAQAEPFRHRAGGPDWFAGTGLPPDAMATVRKYLYRRGDMEAFADLAAVLPALRDDDARARLVRRLASQAALVVRLRVRPDSDLSRLVAYWSHGGVGRDVAPLLESLANVPGGDAIDVAQLLPVFARSRLNTYPPPVNVDGSDRGLFDCHWTTLNFWRAMPDNRFTDPREASRQFAVAYRQIQQPSQLGDIVVLTGPNDEGIHSATLVAADVYFTKNGSSIAAPWILMRLDDVLSYYRTLGPVKTIAFRRNDL